MSDETIGDRISVSIESRPRSESRKNHPDAQERIGVIIVFKMDASVADRESVEHDSEVLAVDQTALIEIPPAVVSADRVEEIHYFVDLG